MTTLAPEATAAESLDPRDPLLRLQTFFDPGSVKPLHERDKSGVLAASGTVNGVHTIAFATDGTVISSCIFIAVLYLFCEAKAGFGVDPVREG